MKLLQRNKSRPGRPQVRDPEADANGPTPQPEHGERRLADPGLTDLSRRDFKAIVIRAGKEALNDQITDLAAALAYYSFLAIPSILDAHTGERAGGSMDRGRWVGIKDPLNLRNEPIAMLGYCLNVLGARGAVAQ